MPELPKVEAFVALIRPEGAGRRISRVEACGSPASCTPASQARGRGC